MIAKAFRISLCLLVACLTVVFTSLPGFGNPFAEDNFSVEAAGVTAAASTGPRRR